jgi:hypothetical protein
MRSGGVPAAVVAGLMLLLASCTQAQNQASSSPDVSPTPTPVAASPTPTPSPTPVESPAVSPTPDTTSPPTPAALIITSLPFHAAEIGVAYAPVTLGASGGTPPYKWSIASGALPPGVALTSAGTASGKPTATGNYPFVVRVEDSAGAAAGVPRTITVVPHLVVTGLCANTCSVEQGCVTVCGRYGTQSGGVAPFRYQLLIGQIPTGMGLKGMNLTGAFPLAPPNNSCECNPPWSFSITVTDALGATDGLNAIYDVFRHIAFSVSGATCGPSYGCQAQLPFTMGTPGGKAVLSLANIVCADPPCTGVAPEPPLNNLPLAGFSAAIDNSTDVVTISFGSPSTTGDWIGTIDVTITDQSLCGPGSTRCSATVTVTVDTETKYG